MLHVPAPVYVRSISSTKADNFSSLRYEPEFSFNYSILFPFFPFFPLPINLCV
jgi:hypothetical protein